LIDVDEDHIDSRMSDRATPVSKLATIFVALASAVWLVFGQTLGHQFVNFDDESYVYANPFISRGLSKRSIAWAFTHIVSQLASADLDLAHARLSTVRSETRWSPFHQCGTAHNRSDSVVDRPLSDHARALWRGAFVAAFFAIHPFMSNRSPGSPSAKMF
jgi:hypothetical protein